MINDAGTPPYPVREGDDEYARDVRVNGVWYKDVWSDAGKPAVLHIPDYAVTRMAQWVWRKYGSPPQDNADLPGGVGAWLGLPLAGQPRPKEHTDEQQYSTVVSYTNEVLALPHRPVPGPVQHPGHISPDDVPGLGGVLDNIHSVVDFLKALGEFILNPVRMGEAIIGVVLIGVGINAVTKGALKDTAQSAGNQVNRAAFYAQGGRMK